MAFRTTRFLPRVLTLVTFIISLSLLSGCQKNSYESCVDFQTGAAKRTHEQNRFGSASLQDIIDFNVSQYCANAR